MKKVVCLLVLVPFVMAVAGCMTAGKGMSDEEMILMTLDQWGQGLVEKNMEKFLATISESFTAPQAESKQVLADFIQQAIDSGYIDDAEVSRTDAQLTIEENTCSVYPIDLMSAAGSVSCELKLAKENGQWLVTGMEVDGI